MELEELTEKSSPRALLFRGYYGMFSCMGTAAPFPSVSDICIVAQNREKRDPEL